MGTMSRHEIATTAAFWAWMNCADRSLTSAANEALADEGEARMTPDEAVTVLTAVQAMIDAP